jgi:hypothetical protein
LCDEVSNTFLGQNKSYQQHLINKEEKVLPTRSTIHPFALIKDAAMERGRLLGRAIIGKQAGSMYKIF